MKFIFIFFFTFLVAQITWAQIKVQKVATAVVKEFPINSKTNITIGANKGDVLIISTNSKFVRLTATLSSNNKDKKTAEIDLLALKFDAYEKGNTLFFTNHVVLGKEGKKPTSNLHIRYLVEVPKTFKGLVKVTNEFGKIELIQTNLKAEFETRFSTVSIENCQGSFRVTSDFGEVNLSNIRGAVYLNTSRSEVNVQNMEGDLRSKSKFSNLELINLDPTAVTEIIDDHSEITIKQTCLKCTHFKFNLTRSELTLPNDIQLNYSTNEAKKIDGTLFSSHLSKVIYIKSESGIISLKNHSK